MFMLVLHILCHNLVGYESSKGLGTKIAECGYETSKSGYEKSMGTKRLVTVFILDSNNGHKIKTYDLLARKGPTLGYHATMFPVLIWKQNYSNNGLF